MEEKYARIKRCFTLKIYVYVDMMFLRSPLAACTAAKLHRDNLTGHRAV